MRLNIQMTAGQRDTLKDLLYEQTQVPTCMDPGMARALFEAVQRAEDEKKAGRRVARILRAAPK